MEKKTTDISYTSLYYFMIVAEECSMTQAAKRLYKTQPALSAAIRKLEESLGYALFERNNNKITLTEAGRCLREYCGSGFTYINDGLRAAEKLARKEDCLSIASSMGIVRRFAEDYTETFHKKIECHVCDTEEVANRVAEGRADIGINFGYLQDIRVTNRVLMQGMQAMAVGQEHPLVGRNSVSIKELPQYQIFVSNIGHTLEKANTLFHAANLSPRILQLDETDVLFRAAELGLGGVLCLPMMAERGINRDKNNLTFIPISDAAEQAYAMLILKRGGYYSNEVLQLIDYIAERFAVNQHLWEDELKKRGIGWKNTLHPIDK